ncbi:IS3 family transposase [Pseudomonas sp. p1(2021b)]|uniref:IS3 family transposase n=1 Tax=Pseudomonas sp. p1(2021b) TaxID=2874628 RepID=UPI00398CDD23
MSAPINRTVVELAKQTGITAVTLRVWRNEAKTQGAQMAGTGKRNGRWSSADKFRAVLQTAAMSEAEISEYCRSAGILPADLVLWRVACEQANTPTQQEPVKDIASVKRIEQLERELRRKEAALAETAALLVLRKKGRCDLGQGRGRMTSAADRTAALQLIDAAVRAGARQSAACEELGLTERTVQRWRHQPEDGRPGAARPEPANKLSECERLAILEAANRPDCADLTPHEIVPKLADEGLYLASESTFYRVLKSAGQAHRRGRSRRPQARPLTTHRASGPNQVWCWDITWLPSTVKGRFFYWYMVKDIYSRKLVMNEVHEAESAEHASILLERACLREGIRPDTLVLHSDNGSAMKGATMLAALRNLGVLPSFSRPRVSNDNAYAEALFRTAKYCSRWPSLPFGSLDEARMWVMQFAAWYNNEHRHSALKYVTPSQRHQGQDGASLRQREQLYEAARRQNPGRWVREVRNWKLPNHVYLNRERDPEQKRTG